MQKIISSRLAWTAAFEPGQRSVPAFAAIAAGVVLAAVVEQQRAEQ